MSSGRLFDNLGTATARAQSSLAFSRDGGTANSNWSQDLLDLRADYWHSRSEL